MNCKADDIENIYEILGVQLFEQVYSKYILLHIYQTKVTKLVTYTVK